MTALTQQEQRDTNKLVLMSFVNFCAANPDMRFWQALSVWAGGRIMFLKDSSLLPFKTEGLWDTFYWTGHKK